MGTNPPAAGSVAQEKGRSPWLGRLFERPAVLSRVRGTEAGDLCPARLARRCCFACGSEAGQEASGGRRGKGCLLYTSRCV